MAKSRNNQRKTMNKFTTNLMQYIPLCNLNTHMIGQPGFITVKNKRQDRVVGVFDYPELCEYLGVQFSGSVSRNSFIN